MRKGKVFFKKLGWGGEVGLSYDNLGEEQRIFCLFSYIEKRIRERGKGIWRGDRVKSV